MKLVYSKHKTYNAAENVEIFYARGVI